MIFLKKPEPINVDNGKNFWKAVKPLFVENGEILQEETEIAES